VKENLRSKSLSTERGVNVFQSEIVGAANKRNEQGRTLGGHDKFLSTQSENRFSVTYQLSDFGGEITTMALHGKSFLCRLHRLVPVSLACRYSSFP
jgi:hypothetical protein